MELSKLDVLLLPFFLGAWGLSWQHDGLIAIVVFVACLLMGWLVTKYGYSRDDKRALQFNEAVFPVYAMVFPILISCIISYVEFVASVQNSIKQYVPLFFLFIVTICFELIILYRRDVKRRMEEDEISHLIVTVDNKDYKVAVKKDKKQDNSSQ